MTILQVATPGQAAVDVTAKIAAIIAASGGAKGLVHLFIQHTSASLTIQENADPDVLADLLDWLDRTAPESSSYRHNAEGPDDMPAHLKSVLTTTSLCAPFENGRLLLGTWQAIYLLEHRRAPQRRRIAVTLVPSL